MCNCPGRGCPGYGCGCALVVATCLYKNCMYVCVHVHMNNDVCMYEKGTCTPVCLGVCVPEAMCMYVHMYVYMKSMSLLRLHCTSIFRSRSILEIDKNIDRPKSIAEYRTERSFYQFDIALLR